MGNQAVFHLAIPINDIDKAKQFYCEGLGCQVGRENVHAIILNLGGHQIVAHMSKEPLAPQKGIYPRHFGLIFPEESDWKSLLAQAQNQKLKFYQEPKLRFADKLIEHRTFFLEDPFYNLLEFKYYRHWEAVFGGRQLAEIGDRASSNLSQGLLN